MATDSQMTQPDPTQMGQLRRKPFSTSISEAYKCFFDKVKNAADKRNDALLAPAIAAIEIEDPTAREIHLRKKHHEIEEGCPHQRCSLP